WIHLHGTRVRVAPTLLSSWIRRSDDPDRRAERHGVSPRMRRERFPNIRRRGGANRFALAVKHPACRPDRHRGADGRVESPADGDVELEIVRLENDVSEAGVAQG